MKKSIAFLASAAVAVGALASAPAGADEGPFMVRLRALYISPANKSDAAGALPADAIHVNSKWAPDIDLEWFFDKNWSSELLLTVPQKHTVSVQGTDIGTFKHLPPTLTVKYNFLPDGTFRPYLGLGVNLTFISDVNLADGALKLDSTSVGGAAQAGFDVKIDEHWFGSVDAKYVMIKSDVKDAASGAKVTTVKVDPWLLGVGFGYRFWPGPCPACFLLAPLSRRARSAAPRR
jgi:outer membrane protein